MSILRKKQLINERYTCDKIGAHGIQIRGKVGAHVLCFWTLVTKVKCLGYLHIENTKKTASTQLLRTPSFRGSLQSWEQEKVTGG